MPANGDNSLTQGLGEMGEGVGGGGGGGRGVERSVSCARECTGYPRGTWHSLLLEEDALPHLLHHSLKSSRSQVSFCTSPMIAFLLRKPVEKRIDMRLDMSR